MTTYESNEANSNWWPHLVATLQRTVVAAVLVPGLPHLGNGS